MGCFVLKGLLLFWKKVWKTKFDTYLCAYTLDTLGLDDRYFSEMAY